MRSATITRKTKETDITASLYLDGGPVRVDTGVGFFDHMLTALAVHGGFGLELACQGDLHVDAHHTVEDCGIVLGKAIAQALGDKLGVARYGSAVIPMDEALAEAAVDISGRAFLVYAAKYSQECAGNFPLCLCEEFWRAVAVNAGITLHMRLHYGANGHHEAEALFKAAAHALRMAVALQPGLRTTKGCI